MRAEELRIGNYVYDTDEKCYTTIGLYDFKEEYFFLYEPIELTEEILLKCGFKISTDKEHFFINHYGFCLVYDGKDYCLKMRIDEPYVVCYSRYLHQLQNLYFALCNEELNVKL